MTRGFVIMAQNTETTDYVKCAEVLKKSILRHMPNANVTIITELPHGDQAPNSDWKLINDWQVYEASPYDETIKLEADMLITTNIEHWWDILQVNDVAVCTTIRNFKNEISHNRGYRKFIDDNKLPDTYNAITYFKKSDTAEYFFKVVRNIFENWEDYKAFLQCNPAEEATTDFVYALACHTVGVEKTTLPGFTEFSMIHMKQFINDLPTEDWTNTLVYEILPDVLRINTCPQMYPLHYHVKTFADRLES
jgi:hypothetical protein